jgi:hypothetical protein
MQIGLPIVYDTAERTYTMESRYENLHVSETANKPKEILYLKKLIRLITIMRHVPDVDCNVWYAETFPDTSKRTMLRDFKIINESELGYNIYYKKGWTDYEKERLSDAEDIYENLEDALKDTGIKPPKRYYSDDYHDDYLDWGEYDYLDSKFPPYFYEAQNDHIFESFLK